MSATTIVRKPKTMVESILRGLEREQNETSRFRRSPSTAVLSVDVTYGTSHKTTKSKHRGNNKHRSISPLPLRRRSRASRRRKVKGRTRGCSIDSVDAAMRDGVVAAEETASTVPSSQAGDDTTTSGWSSFDSGAGDPLGGGGDDDEGLVVNFPLERSNFQEGKVKNKKNKTKGKKALSGWGDSFSSQFIVVGTRKGNSDAKNNEVNNSLHKVRRRRSSAECLIEASEAVNTMNRSASLDALDEMGNFFDDSGGPATSPSETSKTQGSEIESSNKKRHNVRAKSRSRQRVSSNPTTKITSSSTHSVPQEQYPRQKLERSGDDSSEDIFGTFRWSDSESRAPQSAAGGAFLPFKADLPSPPVLNYIDQSSLPSPKEKREQSFDDTVTTSTEITKSGSESSSGTALHLEKNANKQPTTKVVSPADKKSIPKQGGTTDEFFIEESSLAVLNLEDRKQNQQQQFNSSLTSFEDFVSVSDTTAKVCNKESSKKGKHQRSNSEGRGVDDESTTVTTNWTSERSIHVLQFDHSDAAGGYVRDVVPLANDNINSTSSAKIVVMPPQEEEDEKNRKFQTMVVPIKGSAAGGQDDAVVGIPYSMGAAVSPNATTTGSGAVVKPQRRGSGGFLVGQSRRNLIHRIMSVRSNKSGNNNNDPFKDYSKDVSSPHTPLAPSPTPCTSIEETNADTFIRRGSVGGGRRSSCTTPSQLDNSLDSGISGSDHSSQSTPTAHHHKTVRTTCIKINPEKRSDFANSGRAKSMSIFEENPPLTPSAMDTPRKTRKQRRRVSGW